MIEKGPKRVAFELGFSLNRLQALADSPSAEYRKVRIEKNSREQDREIEYRELLIPRQLLAQVQKTILDAYLRVDVPRCVHGGVSGRSNITNAEEHIGSSHFFATDVLNFYPSVRPAWVYEAFRSLGLSGEAASLLTRLCTYDGGLPQGVATSMHLANLVLRPMDAELERLCADNGIVYTRYVDDLAFSSCMDFRHLTSRLLGPVSLLGLKVHRAKTHYSRGAIEITGIVATEYGLRIPVRLHRKLKRMDEASPNYKSLKSYIDRVYAATKTEMILESS